MAKVRAPELVGSGGWIGAPADLTLRDLRGRVVELHFFAFGSIDCARVETDLAEIQRRWPDHVVIVGVHSPKFPHEGRHQAVVSAVDRLGIEHPVLDDPEMATWQQYGVRGWPTVVVVDGQGRVEGGATGQGNRPLLTQMVADAVENLDSRALRRQTVDFAHRPRTPVASVLAFPSKVASDRRHSVAVADTGNDRVVVADLVDGPNDAVQMARISHVITGLRAPRGVRLYGRELIVCDTGNDRVVRIDLASRPGADEDIEADPAGIIRLPVRPSDVVNAELAAPTDAVVDHDRSLVVAEGGRHRLWRVPLDGSSPGVVAGTGFEGLGDGRGGRAELAQPASLARVPGGIVFVDAESSSLRMLSDTGRVGTLVGEGIFDWGLVDGGRRRARLQHPQGLAAAPDGGVLYIADTYNSVVREWYRRSLTTLAATGLAEPEGLDVLGDGRLVVADTGNHRVVVVSPADGRVTPIEFETRRLAVTVPLVEPGAPLQVEPNAPFEIPFEVDLDGLHLDETDGKPVRISVDAQPPWLLDAGPRLWRHVAADGVLKLQAASIGGGWLTVTVSAATKGDGIRTVRQSVTRHTLTVRASELSAPPS